MHETLEDTANQLNFQVSQLNQLLETTASIHHPEKLDLISRDLRKAVDTVIHVICDIQWTGYRKDDDDDI